MSITIQMLVDETKKYRGTERAAVMQAIWTQARPERMQPMADWIQDMNDTRGWYFDGPWTFERALNAGMIYDAKFGYHILVRCAVWMDAQGNMMRRGGVPSLDQAVRMPDGSLINTGDDLVAWRNRRWAKEEADKLWGDVGRATQATPRRKRL